MFTVFGASGNTGAVVANELLTRGVKVRVVARDEAKVKALVARGAEFFKGDVLDGALVEQALMGAEGAYLLLPPDVTSNDLVTRNQQIAKNYAAALSKTGVKHVAFLSSVGAHLPSGTGPITTAHNAEKILGAVTSTKFTFVRAAYFMENILGYAGAMKGDGVLPVFGGGEGYPFPMVATRDIGHVAAEALLSPPSTTEIVNLSGPTNQSFTDAAKYASAILKREVKATPLPIEAMVPALTGFGMSANAANLFREMTEAFGKGIVSWDGNGRTVRGKISLEEVLKNALS